jgi:hypothetical protein
VIEVSNIAGFKLTLIGGSTVGNTGTGDDIALVQIATVYHFFHVKVDTVMIAEVFRKEKSPTAFKCNNYFSFVHDFLSHSALVVMVTQFAFREFMVRCPEVMRLIPPQCLTASCCVKPHD